jgi:membrane associated rhomboid family serine protease
LAKKIKASRNGIDLVWTPASERLVVPESVSGLHQALRTRRKRGADRDISDGLRMSAVFGAIMLYTFFAAWNNSGGEIEALYSQQLTGVAALLLFIFGLLPLYEGWKTRRHLAVMANREMADDLPDAQFDIWMHRQKVPVTYALVGCVLFCGVVQFFIDRSGPGMGGLKLSILRAGLLKQQGLQFLSQFPDATERWRIFTTPMLHGNVVHLLMNSAGLLYLGRRAETLTRWPHLLIVFFISMWVGGFTSFYWYPEQPAVGASGGIMGLLGFLLVFESLNAKLVPRLARRRLAAGVILMGVIGALGMSFIDNAAHVGGLLAGMVYAGIVFPFSASFERPQTMTKDKVVGTIAGAGIFAATLTAIVKMLG